MDTNLGASTGVQRKLRLSRRNVGVAVDNPTYDEAIYMVKVKRSRAKEAMRKIVERYGVISSRPAPGMEVLLDYFMNMVYGLELLLKVLAKDWEIPGQSRYKHRVGEMYQAVFNRPHADPVFIKELEKAIFDQKFVCEPAQGLINRVEAIEALWDELKAEHQKSAGEIWEVKKEVKADASFGQYLLQNVARFTSTATYQPKPMTAEHKIALLRARIDELQRNIARLETEGEPEITIPDIMRRLEREHTEKVQILTLTMAEQFEMRETSAIDFTIYNVAMGGHDLG
jgi:hypothetical protein